MDTKLKNILEELDLDYELVEHEKPGRSTEEVSDDMDINKDKIVKSMLVRESGGGRYFGAIVPGDKRIDFGKLSNSLEGENIKVERGQLDLASPEEVKEVTGKEIGKVHPFVFHLEDIPAFVDLSLRDKEEVIGSAGSEFEGILFNPLSLKEADYKFSDISGD